MLVSDGAYVSFGRMVRASRTDEALIRNEQALRPQRAIAKSLISISQHIIIYNVRARTQRWEVASPLCPFYPSVIGTAFERTYPKPRENVFELPRERIRRAERTYPSPTILFPLSTFSPISLEVSEKVRTFATELKQCSYEPYRKHLY